MTTKTNLDDYLCHPATWYRWAPESILELVESTTDPVAIGYAPDRGWFILRREPEIGLLFTEDPTLEVHPIKKFDSTPPTKPSVFNSAWQKVTNYIGDTSSEMIDDYLDVFEEDNDFHVKEYEIDYTVQYPDYSSGVVMNTNAIIGFFGLTNAPIAWYKHDIDDIETFIFEGNIYTIQLISKDLYKITKIEPLSKE